MDDVNSHRLERPVAQKSRPGQTIGFYPDDTTSQRPCFGRSPADTKSGCILDRSVNYQVARRLWILRYPTAHKRLIAAIDVFHLDVHDGYQTCLGLTSGILRYSTFLLANGQFYQVMDEDEQFSG